MKFLLLFIFSSLLGYFYASVVFLEYPKDKQLFGRDKSTNYGRLKIKGYQVNDNAGRYHKIKTYLFRGQELVQTYIVDLNACQDSISFGFELPIYAELVNYKIETYGVENNVETLLHKAEELLSGDVIVIQGQSNAEAKKRGGESATYMSSDFIRVFAGGFNVPGDMNTNAKWFRGQADGDKNTSGNCGQWGLYLARMLVDSLQIPIAVFNGAHGGTGISFFLEGNQPELSSNYSRLHYRISEAGLLSFVEVIFWAQGEHDAATTLHTSTENYIAKFNQLYSSWAADFPNLEKVFIFQTAKGCETLVQNMQNVTEAQRQISENNSHCLLIPTHGIPFREIDSCHFTFENGYKRFGERAFYSLMTEFYHKDQPVDLSYPKPEHIQFHAPGIIRISFSKNLLVLDSLCTDFYLNGDINLHSYRIRAHMNYLDVYFNTSVNNMVLLSYAGNKGMIPDFTATNTIETARFHLLPIEQSLNLQHTDPDRGMQVYPNPTGGKIKLFMNEPAEEILAEVKDRTGRILFTAPLVTEYTEIDLSFLGTGIYHLNIYNSRLPVESHKIIIQ